MKNPVVSNKCLEFVRGRSAVWIGCTSRTAVGQVRAAVSALTVLALALAISLGSPSEALAGPKKMAASYNAPGFLAAPVQSALRKKKLYSKSGYQLEAIASFKVEARVLSSAQYRTGREAQISQVDLALGWGKMATESVLSKVDVTQSDRFASMHFDPTSGIEVSDIVNNSSNMHMIPSSSAVQKTLRSIRKDQTVQIEGYLVNIRHSDGWRWLTSTRRDDMGDGACEIVLVKSVKIIG